MTKSPKRPRDPNQIAKFVIDAATGEIPAAVETPKIARAKKAGAAGGPARAADGRTITHVASHEAEGVAFVAANVEHGATVHADEASHWDKLAAFFPIKRINHKESYSKDGACTNAAESFFSRLRRSEIGTHHHIAGPYLKAYAREMAWREDCRREANGTQYMMVVAAAAAAHKSSVWCGYWQRRRLI